MDAIVHPDAPVPVGGYTFGDTRYRPASVNASRLDRLSRQQPTTTLSRHA